MPYTSKIKKPTINSANTYEVGTTYSLSSIIKKIKETKIRHSIAYYNSNRYSYPTEIAIYATKSQYKAYKESLRLYALDKRIES
jgi:hypothetical protein